MCSRASFKMFNLLYLKTGEYNLTIIRTGNSTATLYSFYLHEANIKFNAQKLF